VIIILNFFLFYLPLLLSITISSIFVITTIVRIRRQKVEMALNQQLQIQYTFSKNLALYPIILTICWLPSFAIYGYSLIIEKRPQFGEDAETVEYTMSFLQGFLNCLAFLYN
jgi:hypothetical protein